MSEKSKIGSHLSGLGMLFHTKKSKMIMKPAKVILQSDLFRELKHNPKSLTKMSLHW